MEIEITETKSYSFNIGGKKLVGFTVTSEWNGLTELRRGDGDKIIVSGMVSTTPGGFRDVFGDIFAGVGRGEAAPRRVQIISASPGIVELFGAAGVSK